MSVAPHLEDRLTKFWELEEIPKSKAMMPNDAYCEKLYTETTTRDVDGRFVVRLPFARSVKLSRSKAIAINCLARQEKARVKNSKVNEAYCRFMKDYEELRHMHKATALEMAEASYYLPHHAVFRDSDERKIRVVFNASQKGPGGLSLNDLLLSGPKLQSDITAIITQWRLYRFVFMTDIVKMFRQIRLHNADKPWQHILWRESPNSPVLDYVLDTVTYGMAPAPYLAIRSIFRLAEENRETLPEASHALRHESYVDDIYSGGHSFEHARLRRDELIALLASAHMLLGKWASNEPRLLPSTADQDPSEVILPFDDTISALGVKWRASTDVFTFSWKDTSLQTPLTKRVVLSQLAQLFDPLGSLAPVIVIAKLIMQDIWLQKLEWDSPLGTEFVHRWQSFQRSLEFLPRIQIPRFLKIAPHEPWHLLGFSDAFKRAYAAVVYCRSAAGT